MNYQRLLREIKLWLADGLITEAQASKILARYSSDVPVYRRMSFWLKSIAGIFVSLALFLVISENWQRLGYAVQSLVAIAPLLAAQGYALYYEKKGNELPAELGWFLASLFLGVNIMLQAQIFHISAYYPNGMLLWVLGVIPVVFLRSSSIHFLLAALLFCIYLGQQIQYAQFSIVSLIPLAVMAHFTWTKQKAHTVFPFFIVDYLTLWALLEKGGIPQTGIAWNYATLVFAAAFVHQFTELEEKWLSRGLWLLFGVTVFFHILLTFQFFAHLATLPKHKLPIIFLVLLSMAALFRSWRTCRLKLLTLLVAANLLLILAAIAVQSAWPEHATADDTPHYFMRITANAAYLASTVAMLFHAIRERTKAQFMAAVALLLTWALVRYLDLFRDYLVTALIFALAAAALIYLNRLWEKKYEN